MAQSRSAFSPHIGPDGIPTDSPVIAYAEKVLEEKELELKKYIQDNYSKIRNVEREFASLAFEIKLTAGPKKAALEHLRKKIELSAEKIKVAKQKEEQARKAWEVANKALKDEEENKQRLCEDLNRLVQESAASQYSRLEELKKRLEALNPEIKGGPDQSPIANGTEISLLKLGDTSQHKLPLSFNVGSKQDATNSEKLNQQALGTDSGSASKSSNETEDQRDLSNTTTPSNEKATSTHSVVHGEARSRNSHARIGKNARGHGGLVKGSVPSHKPKANTWTGAGFDVDDSAVNG